MDNRIVCSAFKHTKFKYRQSAKVKNFKCKQRGTVAVMVAVTFPILIGFAALGVDVAQLMVARNELQNAADAAALAGVPCLFHRDFYCKNTANPTPDWTTAELRATSAISLNTSMGTQLVHATVESGYWNLGGDPKQALQPPPLIPPLLNNVPAVKVTVSRDSEKNGGAIGTWFAGILGINAVSMSASAVAVLSSPGSIGTHVAFPFAMGKCAYEKYWDATTGKPKTAESTSPIQVDGPNQVIGQPYKLWITSDYHSPDGCYAGQWTSFQDPSNSEPAVEQFLSNGNTEGINIGDSIHISTGSMTTIYDNKKGSVESCRISGACEYAIVPVVEDAHATGTFQKVVGFACVHVDVAVGNSKKYVQIQMSNDPIKCQTLNAGGSGPSYGALAPPRLAL